MSSQAAYLESLKATKLWRARSRLLHISEGEIKIRWVPSHAGIYGNKLAEIEARKGAAMPCKSQQKYLLASLGRWQKAKMENSRDNWWQFEAPHVYIQLEIKSAPIPKELLLSREFLGNLIASRTGNVDFVKLTLRR